MKHFIAGAAALLLLTESAEASRTYKAKCPTTIPVVKTLDLSKYVGRWYELKRDRGTPYEYDSVCVTATYQKNSNGGIDVYNRGWYWWLFFTYWNLKGEAKCTNGSGACEVNFSPFREATWAQSSSPAGKENYHVLDTDYTSYSIVYSCRD